MGTNNRNFSDIEIYNSLVIVDPRVICTNIFVYNDADTSWEISFLSCFKVTYETDATWRSITKVWEMKKNQLGYFGQDITLSENKEYKGFYDVSIMIAKIICKDVNVELVSNNILDIFLWKDGE